MVLQLFERGSAWNLCIDNVYIENYIKFEM